MSRRPNKPKHARNWPAVFLDRDGTIIEEVGYVNHLDRVRLYSWSAKAIRKLNQAGRLVIAVTNQSGVARGHFTEDLVRETHEKIARELAARGARVDAFYYCPHHPDARVAEYRLECRCRKPGSGLLERAAKEFSIDLGRSTVVGDSYRDMEMGFNVGARTVLVLTGYGRGEYEFQRDRWARLPDRVAENLLGAVEIILADPWTRLALRPPLSVPSDSRGRVPARSRRERAPEGCPAVRAGEGARFR